MNIPERRACVHCGSRLALMKPAKDGGVICMEWVSCNERRELCDAAAEAVRQACLEITMLADCCCACQDDIKGLDLPAVVKKAAEKRREAGG